MKIYKEISLADFKSWFGAVDTMETLRKLEDETGANVFDTLEVCIDDMGEGVDETTVNDILWFETDTIAEWLGYEDWEALERAAEGIEEEDEAEFENGTEVKIIGYTGIFEVVAFDNGDYLIKEVEGNNHFPVDGRWFDGSMIYN